MDLDFTRREVVDGRLHEVTYSEASYVELSTEVLVSEMIQLALVDYVDSESVRTSIANSLAASMQDAGYLT